MRIHPLSEREVSTQPNFRKQGDQEEDNENLHRHMSARRYYWPRRLLQLFCHAGEIAGSPDFRWRPPARLAREPSPNAPSLWPTATKPNGSKRRQPIGATITAQFQIRF